MQIKIERNNINKGDLWKKLKDKTEAYEKFIIKIIL